MTNRQASQATGGVLLLIMVALLICIGLAPSTAPASQASVPAPEPPVAQEPAVKKLDWSGNSPISTKDSTIVCPAGSIMTDQRVSEDQLRGVAEMFLGHESWKASEYGCAVLKGGLHVAYMARMKTGGRGVLVAFPDYGIYGYTVEDELENGPCGSICTDANTNVLPSLGDNSPFE